jgi:PAS domain S-box-containing protein
LGTNRYNQLLNAIQNVDTKLKTQSSEDIMPDSEKIQKLRNKAGKILKNGDSSDKKDELNEDVARLLEELSIHQIELEMQNDELQKSQQELENQKNKYIDLYENAPVAYLTISPTGNIETQNHKARDLFGTSNRDFNYISIFPYIDPVSKTNFRKMLKNTFLLHQEQQGEIRMTTAGKTLVHTKMHMAIYYDSEREQDLCRITITDIDIVREVFNRQLQESEERYRQLAENISEGIYLTENGYIKMLNTPACKLFGFEKYEMIDRKVWDFVKPDQQEDIKKLFINKISKQDGSPVELECVRKDGSTFWAKISMRIIRDEKRVFGVISDVSEQRKAEGKLRRSEQRLQMALKGTNAGLWDWNINTGTVIFDQRWADILGYNLREIEPHISSWEKLIHPQDFAAFEKNISEHLQGKTNFYRSIHRMKAKNGEWKYILDSGMVIEKSRTSKPLRAVGTHQDMTIQKQIEQKLREINATKDKLFSIIAHDLKSPYNAQLGFLELLIEGEDSYTPEQRKKFINTIYRSTKQSFSLLDNLLMWSRTQTGKIPFNPTELLLAQVFEEAIDLHNYAAAAKNITIDTDLCSESLEITADYEMVGTILRNLLSNAIKFTPENGKIILGGKTASDNKILVFVSDTGVGIPHKDQEMLFDATSNYTTIGTNKEKGTGIGLVICKDFVERNGGKIWVESEPGQGSTFYFTLDSLKKTRICDSNCISNFELIGGKIKQNKELHQYFLNNIIPVFRHTYQKFSTELIHCFLDEIKQVSKKYHIEAFDTFVNMILKSIKENDTNKINICFAEFEKLTDELEIIGTKTEHQK